ncbi:MAG: hypothetical protein QW507_02070 [Candidatus Nanoarchaeia archaeon]|nr:hypothetical protein [Candidatus Haiyanarchaeum thermophilum]MCW1302800.1 hypothetical protein [Candidatus Haiyanarchaeum thermophilum]MCW1303481.1 hypothetical protein [Candidatus Haiyanarchaeum thermophilum]MCW1306661.1 hypothetical protein [Candidatus Haiyanarchaeum thermophilum]MCW1307383.1 hypothetical protein [Candidatus Haiyanarchaeum thermophilum]
MQILRMRIDSKSKKGLSLAMKCLMNCIIFYIFSTILFDLLGLKLASQVIYLLTMVYFMILLYCLDEYVEKYVGEVEKYVRLKSYVIAAISLLLLLFFLAVLTIHVEDVNKWFSAIISLIYIFAPLLLWEDLIKFTGAFLLILPLGNLSIPAMEYLSNLSLTKYFTQAWIYLTQFGGENLPLFLIILMVTFYFMLKFLEQVIKILIVILVIWIMIKLLL